MEKESNHIAAFVTAEAIAQMLNVHPATIRRMVAAGMLPSYRLGGSAIRFSVEEVKEALGAFRMPAIGEGGHGNPEPPVGGSEVSRSEALQAVISSIAGKAEDAGSDYVFELDQILAGADEQGVRGLLTIGKASPGRSIGRALQALRGKVLRDSKGRAFELIREERGSKTFYRIQF